MWCSFLCYCTACRYVAVCTSGMLQSLGTLDKAWYLPMACSLTSFEVLWVAASETLSTRRYSAEAE